MTFPKKSEGIFEKKITLGGVIQIVILVFSLGVAYTRQEMRLAQVEKFNASLQYDIGMIKTALIRAGLLYKTDSPSNGNVKVTP